MVKEVKGKLVVRMLQTELEGGRGIHNTSGEFKKVISEFNLNQSITPKCLFLNRKTNE